MTKFLLYLSQPYSIPICRPLQAEIERRGLAVRWFCDEPATKAHLDQTARVLHTVAEVKHYQPDVVLVATNVVPHFFSGIKVQIFHGFSVGKRSHAKGHFNIRGFFDLYCTQGPSTTTPFKALQAKHRHFEVVETGWSKVDPLFPLPPSLPSTPRKVVMISSTFTTRLSLAKNPTAVAEIARLARLGEWEFIAVLHPKMEREIVEQFWAMEGEHFHFYDTTELIPLFKRADVMLSDTTSAITEFVLQHKPVVTLNNNQPQPYMINITDAHAIEGAIREALTRPPKVMEALEGFIAQTHPYADGRSSQRVVEACLDFLRHHTIKRKPLNLIRKYKIWKRLRALG